MPMEILLILAAMGFPTFRQCNRAECVNLGNATDVHFNRANQICNKGWSTVTAHPYSPALVYMFVLTTKITFHGWTYEEQPFHFVRFKSIHPAFPNAPPATLASPAESSTRHSYNLTEAYCTMFFACINKTAHLWNLSHPQPRNLSRTLW